MLSLVKRPVLDNIVVVRRMLLPSKARASVSVGVHDVIAIAVMLVCLIRNKVVFEHVVLITVPRVVH